jgi:hypothetical protein
VTYVGRTAQQRILGRGGAGFLGPQGQDLKLVARPIWLRHTPYSVPAPSGTFVKRSATAAQVRGAASIR